MIMVQWVSSFVIVILQDTYRTTFYPIYISGRSFFISNKNQRSIWYVFLDRSNINPICQKSSLTHAKNNSKGWKSLAIVLKGFNLFGFLDPPLVENKTQFRSKAEVYHALQNLFEKREAAPNFRKKIVLSTN